MEDNSFRRLPSQMLFGELKEGVCQQGSQMKIFNEIMKHVGSLRWDGLVWPTTHSWYQSKWHWKLAGSQGRGSKILWLTLHLIMERNECHPYTGLFRIWWPKMQYNSVLSVSQKYLLPQCHWLLQCLSDACLRREVPSEVTMHLWSPKENLHLKDF